MVLLRAASEAELFLFVRELTVTQLSLCDPPQIRSMSEYLVSTDLISNPRRARFSPQFREDLTSLIAVTTRYITDRGQERQAASGTPTLLNRALAFFISDLFSIMDRTFVLQNVKHYCKTVRGGLVRAIILLTANRSINLTDSLRR